MAASKRTLAPPLGAGDWYELARPRLGPCAHCGRQGSVTVQVLEHGGPDVDPGGDLARRFPGWARCGWLLEYVCAACHDHQALAAPAKLVVALGKACGGWVRR